MGGKIKGSSLIYKEAWFVQSSWRDRLDLLWSTLEDLDSSLPDVQFFRERVEGLERFVKHQGEGMCEPGRLSVQKALDAIESLQKRLLQKVRYR